MYEFEETRRISYDCGDNGVAQFIPKCDKCGRFVKADETIKVGYAGLKKQPNATCNKCGRIEMIFEGFFLPIILTVRA